MTKRPKIKLQLTIIDRIFEIATLIILLMTWILIVVSYTKLPDIVPTHFNALGEVDDFGGKRSILTLPVIATVMYIGLIVLNQFPHIFNYPKNITEENAFIQYVYATRLVRYLNFIVVLIFGYFTLETIRNANGNMDGLGIWSLPLILALVFFPMVFYLVKAFKN